MGRKRLSDEQRRVHWTTRVTSDELATLRQYNQALAASLLAQSLKLAAGNVPSLSEAGRQLLSDVLADGVTAETLRSLPERVEASGRLGSAVLVAKLRPLGDWERLVLAVQLGRQRTSSTLSR